VHHVFLSPVGISSLYPFWWTHDFMTPALVLATIAATASFVQQSQRPLQQLVPIAKPLVEIPNIRVAPVCRTDCRDRRQNRLQLQLSHGCMQNKNVAKVLF